MGVNLRSLSICYWCRKQAILEWIIVKKNAIPMKNAEWRHCDAKYNFKKLRKAQFAKTLFVNEESLTIVVGGGPTGVDNVC
jgi:NADH dehydrogenase FAD-containing subunit